MNKRLENRSKVCPAAYEPLMQRSVKASKRGLAIATPLRATPRSEKGSERDPQKSPDVAANTRREDCGARVVAGLVRRWLGSQNRRKAFHQWTQMVAKDSTGLRFSVSQQLYQFNVLNGGGDTVVYY